MTRGALYAQAIRGPLVLITVGVLFAIHQAGVISFSRTWPLIIIVIGFIKLAERLALPAGYQGSRYSAPYPPPNPQGFPAQPPPPPPGATQV